MNSHRHWLNQERLSFYPRIILTLLLIIICYLWFFMFNNMADPVGKPFGYDFITYWAASKLALTGHAQDAYNSSLLFKAQQIAVPAAWRNSYTWFYPPAFFLLVLPFALLPYILAYWAFMLSTLCAFALVMRRIVQGKIAIWIIAAFPGLWVNLFFGQNAFLTATLAGSALLGIERRPVLAGLLIGLLAAIKPHLALLFPVALLAIGAWRTIITAALTAITCTSIGTITLGIGVLNGFIANLDHARLMLENGFIPWSRMPTVFAFLRLIGIPVALTYVIHFVFASGVVILVWHVWRRCQDQNLRGAALMTGTFLISPYLLDYDLVWLAFPIAWIASDGIRNGWSCGERELLVVIWLLPLLMMIQIFTSYSVQTAPFLLISMLWIASHRAKITSIIKATENGDLKDRLETI
ncbi:MAG: DUF2029 domain-containing protein [Chlorobiaceae bacterium]|nr:DUF2029 domain-containing protein [Chlorobiaceae bacterium]